jgi:hypothetical protein
MTMDADELDRRLTDLADACERISANLLELELDPDRRYIDGSTLTGVSAQSLEAAEAAIAELWRQHHQLQQIVERGRKLRRRSYLMTPAREELEQILDGPSIALAGEAVTLADRRLLADPQNRVMVTPSQLVATMSASFDQAKLVFARIAEATKTSLPALRAAQDRIAEATALADRLGVRSRPDLLAAEAQLAPLANGVLHDPLSVDPSEVEALARSVDAIAAQLAELVTFSEQITQRLEHARTQLAGVHALARDGAAAHDQRTARIAGPAAEPIEIPDELDQQLNHIAQLARSGDWPGAHDALAGWTRSLDALRDRAADVVAANRAPIASRDQLRGLLDAYRAKAGRLGVIEDPELADLFARAHDTLFVAPTDLDEARELVRRCQHGVLVAARQTESEISR